MKNQFWIAILIGVGLPLLICGGLGFIALATRPGHSASDMFLAVFLIVVLLAAIPIVIRRLNKR